MAALQIVLALAYPFAVYLALGRFEPRQIAPGLLGLLVLRLALTSPRTLVAATRAFWLPVTAVAAVAAATWTTNDPTALLLAPVGVNAALLASFAHSLRTDRSMAERFARLQVPDLTAAEVVYCANVTRVWCGFFVVNGSIALWLAAANHLSAWTLYTGLISYVAMGFLFAAEYLYRHYRFRRYVGSFTDPLLRRLFPPRETPPPSPALAPTVLAERASGERREIDWRIPADLACLPGHFPGRPIVPGVVQVDWVMNAIARWSGRPVAIAAIEALKFRKPLRPGDEVTLVLESDPGGDRYHFEMREMRETHADHSSISTGRIILTGGDTEP